MPNMSYCRFQNTYQDMVDCHEAMMDVNELRDLSRDELRALKNMLELVSEMAEDLDEVEQSINYYTSIESQIQTNLEEIKNEEQ